jgi:membrane-associated phospholipid phosphatase
MQYIIYDWLGLNKFLFIKINYIMNLWLLPYFNLFCRVFFDIDAFLAYYTIFIIFFIYQIRGDNFSYEKYLQYFNITAKIGAIYATIVISYALMKYGFKMPRPYCSIKGFFSSQSFHFEQCFVSFPSSHTAIAVLLCYSLFDYVSRIYKILLCILVILAGASRIGLGMHYPADVLYSIFISLSICILIEKVIYLPSVQKNILQPIAGRVYSFLLNK